MNFDALGLKGEKNSSEETSGDARIQHALVASMSLGDRITSPTTPFFLQIERRCLRHDEHEMKNDECIQDALQIGPEPSR